MSLSWVGSSRRCGPPATYRRGRPGPILFFGASEQASKQASHRANKPASQLARQQAGRQAGKQSRASQQASKPARAISSKPEKASEQDQASKIKQASKSKQAISSNSKQDQASQQANKAASEGTPASKPASQQASKPASEPSSHRANKQVQVQSIAGAAMEDAVLAGMDCPPDVVRLASLGSATAVTRWEPKHPGNVKRDLVRMWQGEALLEPELVSRHLLAHRSRSLLSSPAYFLLALLACLCLRFALLFPSACLCI